MYDNYDMYDKYELSEKYGLSDKWGQACIEVCYSRENEPEGGGSSVSSGASPCDDQCVPIIPYGIMTCI